MSENISSQEVSPKADLSKQFFDFCNQNQIPINHNLLPETHIKRYGSEFLQSTGKLIRRGTSPDSNMRMGVLGLDSGSLEEEITKEIMENNPETEKRALQDLLRLEMVEVLNNPTGRYRGLLKLDKIQERAKGIFKDLTGIIAGIYHPETAGNTKYPTFTRYQERNRWAVCKDSEFYLAARLNNNLRQNYDASITVFIDKDGKSILMQKTGGYKTELQNNKGVATTNATAINLVPIVVEGVVIPPGTLLGIHPKDNNYLYTKRKGDQIKQLNDIDSIIPLRLTIFAIPEKERLLACGKQYEEYINDERVKHVRTLEQFKERTASVLNNSK